MLGERVLHDPVDGAGPVEPGRNREPAGHRRRLEPADLLHPPDVELEVRTMGGQRVQGEWRILVVTNMADDETGDRAFEL